jgi:hypothetical protein
MMSASVTGTSRMVQTSKLKTEASALTSERYEVGATSIEHGMVCHIGENYMLQAQSLN